jgi:tetratricopeptide (TPR) repeat protein
LDTPSEKVLDDKEKKFIDKIIIEWTTLKNWWKYDEYEKKIIEWLAIDPSNLELTKMLADYYFTIWAYKKALPLLKKIVERVPQDDKSLWQIWEIYFINGDNWTAELLIDKAVNLRPDSPKYNLSLVEIYYNTDRIMEAISCMEKVIKLRPTNTNYLFTLAMLYEEIWDVANAKKNYFTILEFEPSNDKAKKKLRQLTE